MEQCLRTSEENSLQPRILYPAKLTLKWGFNKGIFRFEQPQKINFPWTFSGSYWRIFFFHQKELPKKKNKMGTPTGERGKRNYRVAVKGSPKWHQEAGTETHEASMWECGRKVKNRNKNQIERYLMCLTLLRGLFKFCQRVSGIY